MLILQHLDQLVDPNNGLTEKKYHPESVKLDLALFKVER